MYLYIIYCSYIFLLQGKTPSLKKLAQSILGLDIQEGEHDSVSMTSVSSV